MSNLLTRCNWCKAGQEGNLSDTCTKCKAEGYLMDYKGGERVSEQELEQYARDKIKVRVTFESGNKKWGWVHQHNGKWWLTRGNRVGFSMDTAIKVEEISK